MKGIRIVEHKFITHYLLKIISVSGYCNIIKNKIFSHVRIIVHKMTVLIFHAVELFLDLSLTINLKEKKSKRCQCILLIDLIHIIFCVIWDKNLSCKLVIKQIIDWYTNILYGPMLARLLLRLVCAYFMRCPRRCTELFTFYFVKVSHI